MDFTEERYSKSLRADAGHDGAAAGLGRSWREMGAVPGWEGGHGRGRGARDSNIYWYEYESISIPRVGKNRFTVVSVGNRLHSWFLFIGDCVVFHMTSVNLLLPSLPLDQQNGCTDAYQLTSRPGLGARGRYNWMIYALKRGSGHSQCFPPGRLMGNSIVERVGI